MQLAHRLQRCAVIDVDLVRWMVVQPHKAPWDGEEGKRQQILGVRNTCLLTQSFLEANLTVLILDVLSHETATLYKELLGTSAPKVILLLPTFAEIIERNRIRPRLTDEELSLLYEQSMQFTLYDEKVDNTNVSSEQLVEWFLAKYPVLDR
ncbi:MAG TPA: hypothetical protein VGN34_23195 [Ktedonobacteraceae bacterium]